MVVFVFQPIIISLIMRVQYIHNGFYTYSNMHMPITIIYITRKWRRPWILVLVYVRIYVRGTVGAWP